LSPSCLFLLLQGSSSCKERGGVISDHRWISNLKGYKASSSFLNKLVELNSSITDLKGLQSLLKFLLTRSMAYSQEWTARKEKREGGEGARGIRTSVGSVMSCDSFPIVFLWIPATFFPI
jgi:hypothetical protein